MLIHSLSVHVLSMKILGRFQKCLSRVSFFFTFVTFLSVTLLLVLKPWFTDGMFFFRFEKFHSIIACDSIDKTAMNLHVPVFV